MHIFKTKVESSDDNKEYFFVCYPNTEPINIGDKFLFFFAGIADVAECGSEQERYEVNPNDRVRDEKLAVDSVTKFWQKCYKIKRTKFDLASIL